MGTEIVVAELDGKIIAVSHNMNLRIKIGPSVLLTQYSTDVTTHQNYRGIGVFGDLVKEVERLRTDKNVRLGYGVTTNPAVIKEWGKRGRIPFPHPISIMDRIIDVDLHIKKHNFENAYVLRAGYKTLSSLSKIRRKFKSKNNHVEDFNLVKADHFTEDIDDFWATIRGYYGFIHEKSSSYLNWRYCDPRAGEHYIKVAVSGGKILGYAVSELKNDEYPKGQIVELLALPERLDVINALFEDSCNYFDGLGVNVVHYLVVKGHPYQGISNDHGFIDSRGTPYITLQVIESEKEYEVLKASLPSQIYFDYSTLI